MDQHPIPQDVTGFQFKLVGSMTVKQFGFVASGVILAVVLYYMPFPGPVLLAGFAKFFLIPLVGGSGFAIAFLPIEGRPIDVMTVNFAKAIFSPNQYVYHKAGRQFSFSTIVLEKPPVPTAAQAAAPKHVSDNSRKNQQLQAYLMNTHAKPAGELDQRESAFLKTLSMLPTSQQPTMHVATPNVQKPPTAQPIHATPAIQPAQKPIAAPAPAPIAQPIAAAPKIPPQPQPVAPQQPSTQKVTPDALAQKETALTQQLQAAKQVESTQHTPAEVTTAHQKVQALEQQVQEIHRQKQQLEQELIQLKTQLHTTQELQQPAKPVITQAAAQVVTPPPAQQPTQPVQQTDPAHVHTLPQNAMKKAGLPHVPDTANVVVGIVKDPRGNILPNILVEVKDKEGNPVRAFKTNPLGQFASATPLSTGVYTIELEDPKKQHKFDIIQIAANNQIMLPIEIISHDAREDLRKELFTN